MDPHTGKRVWTFPQYDVTEAGLMTTASDLVFTGGREGFVYALDGKTGKELWKAHLGGQINMAPITYCGGRKAVCGGHRWPHPGDLRAEGRLRAAQARSRPACERAGAG